MKICRLAFISLALFTATVSSAHESPLSKRLFQRLSEHPDFKTTLYKDQGLILQEGEDKFYAAFAVVTSESNPVVCAYAAPFDAAIGTEPGHYVFKPLYICDKSDHLKPYLGYFEIKVPPCGLEVCANPAIGVGNLLILPDQDFDLNTLPNPLPVKVGGELDFPNSGRLPVARGTNSQK